MLSARQIQRAGAVELAAKSDGLACVSRTVLYTLSSDCTMKHIIPFYACLVFVEGLWCVQVRGQLKRLAALAAFAFCECCQLSACLVRCRLGCLAALVCRCGGVGSILVSSVAHMYDGCRLSGGSSRSSGRVCFTGLNSRTGLGCWYRREQVSIAQGVQKSVCHVRKGSRVGCCAQLSLIGAEIYRL